eukprot:TRINITY_DN23653_c0_g1_i1.p1 TRINITY_DN23653_c0_g1~~TRINITY_DN23653_c0_g1_i1.p1  ORF type:complete len:192 (-),score=42.19 TRINITY_DN23653_c0_g1_i1:277-852(-)
MTDLKIILGSSSKWRKQVLERMGYTFSVLSPDIDEKAIRDPDPVQLTLKIARAKADELVSKVTEPAILICSDQVIVCNGEIREKPVDEAQARAFLKSYTENPAEAVVGVVVVNTATGKRLEATDIAKQHFKSITDELIERLIADGTIFWCAGGFAIELMDGHLGPVDGDRDTIMGLPNEVTRRLIEAVAKP